MNFEYACLDFEEFLPFIPRTEPPKPKPETMNIFEALETFEKLEATRFEPKPLTKTKSLIEPLEPNEQNQKNIRELENSLEEKLKSEKQENEETILITEKKKKRD